MKAPDKIYIPLYPNYNLDGVHLGDDWMYEPHKECDNVEYLRKDALLKLLREKESQVLECSATNERKVAALTVFDFLIEKVESL